MRKAFRFYFVNIILAVIILVIVAIIFICMVCNLHEVTVTGSTIYSDEEIEEMIIDGKYPNNAVYEAFYNWVKPKRDIPFLSDVSVRLTRYDQIEITVTEKDIVGYTILTDQTYAYFDEDAVVLEVSDRLIDSAILVSGITLDEAEVGQELDLQSDSLDLIALLLKAEEKYEIAVNDISFDESGDATFTTSSVAVVVGDKSYFEEKMMRLSYILSQLEGKSGTLHLENFTPDTTDIVFEPTEG